MRDYISTRQAEAEKLQIAKQLKLEARLQSLVAKKTAGRAIAESQ